MIADCLPHRIDPTGRETRLMSMERGVYAQGWFARGYNYHPSLPPRRLKMAEDFADTGPRS